MTRINNLIIVLLTLQFFSCLSPRDKDKGFYNCFSEDWDYEIIPLVKPYFLGSTGGQNWLLSSDTNISYGTEHGSGVDRVQDFGVSQGFFFGRDKNNWFLFDFKSQLYAAYDTKDELIACLKSLSIPITEIKSCAEYQKDLHSNGRCYWYPSQGQNYTTYADLKPLDVVDLLVSNYPITGADFKVDSVIKFHKNHIYFFKFNIADKNNDLLYFGLNWKSNVPIKDGIVMPIFIQSENFDITLYTPFPVAKQKGISDDARIYIKKQIKITSDK